MSQKNMPSRVEILDEIKKMALPNLNEADTRHRLIDIIIHQVFDWPKNKVKCEPHINSGYIDYLLKGKTEESLLIIEAKKNSMEFFVPSEIKGRINISIKMNLLLTDKDTKDAIEQAKSYGIQEGVKYLAVSNGKQWIFFRTFVEGIKWDNQTVVFLQDINHITENLKWVDEYLLYDAITRNSLNSYFTRKIPHRSVHSPIDKIHSYDDIVSPNSFARYLRIISEEFFDSINHNADKMREFYVTARLYQEHFSSIQETIRDGITPFFKSRGVNDTRDDKQGGALGHKIASSTRSSVILLFGDRGAGKSTFLCKLLKFDLPNDLEKSTKVAIVDLLTCSHNKSTIEKTIYSSILSQLTPSEIEEGIPYLKILFDEELKLAKNEELFGFKPDSHEYLITEKNLLLGWKNDFDIFYKAISRYWKKLGKKIVLAIDNTDQFEGKLQDYCFTLSQEISDKFGSIVLLALREDRYFASELRGILDAYQTPAYHLPSPDPFKVFERRLQYVRKVLEGKEKKIELNTDGWPIREIVTFLNTCLSDLTKDSSTIRSIIFSSSMGNIRNSLKYFTSYITSGYCNISEIVSLTSWKIAPHQLIKAIMIPTRHFYQQSSSPIPNIFELKLGSRSSHFTMIRIIASMIDGSRQSTSQIIDEHDSNFGLVEDCIFNIDKGLKFKIFDSDNKVDNFDGNIPLDLELTTFGRFIFEYLHKNFTYVDLVSYDAGLYDKTLSNSFTEHAKSEIKWGKSGDKIKRMESRVERIIEFMKYLAKEEKDETDCSRFSYEMMRNLDCDIIKMSNSIKKLGKSNYLKNFQDSGPFATMYGMSI